MALTKPKLSQNIDTDISVFTDPILVLHQGSSLANVDTGFLFNRANGLVSNVAVYWSESANSFVTAFTTSSGAPDANISITTYANLRTGTVTSNSITNSGTLVIGNTGDVSSNIGAFYTYANTTFATVSGTSSGIDANLGAFQTYANTKIGTNNNGNLVINSTTESYGTTSGALVVKGGAGIAGNLWVSGNIYVANLISVASSTLSVQDPLLYLTASSLSPYNYDIGFYSQFVGGSLNNYQHTGFSRDVNTSTWTLFSNVFAEPGITINWTEANIVFDPIKVGSANIANTTISTSTSTGALVVGGGVGVAGNIYAANVVTSSGLINNLIVPSGTFTLGSQVFYTQGTNGFSVNENFDPSNNSDQTVYHFTSGAGRANIAFSLARTGQFTDGFGVYGTSADNTFVTFGEQGNTSFEWRNGIGIQPLNLSGGTQLMKLSADGNLVIVATTTSTSNVTGALVVAGGVGVSGNIYANTIYTTTGIRWAGNGVAFSSGGGAFSVVNVLSSNELTANAEGVSKLTLIGIDGISITSNSATDTITFSATTTAESIWATDHDSGLVTDGVVLSEDNGLVTDVAVSEYDLGTITITGVITGDTIAVNSIPGNRLIAGTDISVGNISAAGNLSFTGTTKRIVADFTSSPVSQRLMFQTNTAGGSTNVYGIPNGAGTTASFSVANNSDPDNASIGQLAQLSTELRIQNVITGTGTYLPMTFYTGGSERVKIDATSGNVVITPTTTSTTATTGALVVRGGIGVAGNINIDQLATITGNVIMSSNVTISRSLGVGTAVAGNVGEIRATNYITAFYSDKRLKSNIEPITSALDKVKHLAGVLYTQNTLAEQYGYNDYGQQVGLFAQDVQQVLPQAVKPAPFDIGPNGTSISGQNYLTIQYEKMVPLLVEAIKELSDIVDQLKEH